MRKYSQRCHFVFDTEEGTHQSPCSLDRGHKERHRDGYGKERDPEKHWYKRIDYQEQFDELVDRVTDAGLTRLLEGFE